MSANGHRSDGADFLTALWGPTWTPRKASLWEKSDKTTHYLDRPADADRFADEVDVYVAAGLVARDLGPKVRGRVPDITGIPGVWADVDVNGGPLHKIGVAPDEEAALELARSILPPTLTIRSGYGVQAWWLFDQPWTWELEDDATRAEAQALLQGFWRRAASLAHQAGFKLDNTSDLARLMRLPGTFNGKGGLRAPVTWLDADDLGPRYPIAKLIGLGERGATSRPNVVALRLTPGAHDPAQLNALLVNDDAFKQAWKRTGPAPSDSSASGWCLRLANLLVRADLDDQPIADLLAHYRREHGDTAKPPAWFGRTIAKARTGRSRADREQAEAEALEDAYDELADAADAGGAADPERVLASFTTLCHPALDAREFKQQGTDSESVRYIIVRGNGQEIDVGNRLDDQAPVRRAIQAACGLTLRRVKPDRWDKAAQALLNVRQLINTESEEEVTLSWLQGYPDRGGTEDEAKWNEAAYERRPYERDGFVYIALEGFLRHVRNGVGEKGIKRADLQRRLHRAGLESGPVNCGPPGGRGNETSRNVWSIAKGMLR